MKNQIDQSTPFLAFYDLLRIRGIYSTEEKREKLRRGFRRAMALAATLVALALPQSAWGSALSGLMENPANVNDDGSLKAGAYRGLPSGAFMDSNDHVTITGSGKALFQTSGSWAVTGGDLTYASGWIYLLANGGLTFSGGTIDAAGLVAAAMNDFSFGKRYSPDDVGGNVTISGGSLPSTKVFIGKTVTGGDGATVVATGGLSPLDATKNNGKVLFAVSDSGGTITFVNAKVSSGSSQASTITFLDEIGENSDEGTAGSELGNVSDPATAGTAYGKLYAAQDTLKDRQTTLATAQSTLDAARSTLATAEATFATLATARDQAQAAAAANPMDANLAAAAAAAQQQVDNQQILVDNANATVAAADADVTAAASDVTTAETSLAERVTELDAAQGAYASAMATAEIANQTALASAEKGNGEIAGGTVMATTVNGATVTISGSGNATAATFDANVVQTAGAINALNSGLEIKGTLDNTGTGTIDANGALTLGSSAAADAATTLRDTGLAATTKKIIQKNGTITVSDGSLGFEFQQDGGTVNSTTFEKNVTQSGGTINATTFNGNVVQTAGAINSSATGLEIKGTLNNTGTGTIDAKGALTLGASAAADAATTLRDAGLSDTTTKVIQKNGTITVSDGSLGFEFQQDNGTANSATFEKAVEQNAGTINGQNGSLTFGAAVTKNAGTIGASGQNVTFNGNVKQEGSGKIVGNTVTANGNIENNTGIEATTLTLDNSSQTYELNGANNNISTLSGSAQSVGINNGVNNLTLSSLSAKADIGVTGAKDVTLDGVSSGGKVRVLSATGEVSDTSAQGAVALELGRRDAGSTVRTVGYVNLVNGTGAITLQGVNAEGDVIIKNDSVTLASSGGGAESKGNVYAGGDVGITTAALTQNGKEISGKNVTILGTGDLTTGAGKFTATAGDVLVKSATGKITTGATEISASKNVVIQGTSVETAGTTIEAATTGTAGTAGVGINATGDGKNVVIGANTKMTAQTVVLKADKGDVSIATDGTVAMDASADPGGAKKANLVVFAGGADGSGGTFTADLGANKPSSNITIAKAATAPVNSGDTVDLDTFAYKTAAAGGMEITFKGSNIALENTAGSVTVNTTRDITIINAAGGSGSGSIAAANVVDPSDSPVTVGAGADANSSPVGLVGTSVTLNTSNGTVVTEAGKAAGKVTVAGGATLAATGGDLSITTKNNKNIVIEDGAIVQSQTGDVTLTSGGAMVADGRIVSGTVTVGENQTVMNGTATPVGAVTLSANKYVNVGATGKIEGKGDVGITSTTGNINFLGTADSTEGKVAMSAEADGKSVKIGDAGSASEPVSPAVAATVRASKDVALAGGKAVLALGGSSVTADGKISTTAQEYIALDATLTGKDDVKLETTTKETMTSAVGEYAAGSPAGILVQGGTVESTEKAVAMTSAGSILVGNGVIVTAKTTLDMTAKGESKPATETTLAIVQGVRLAGTVSAKGKGTVTAEKGSIEQTGGSLSSAGLEMKAKDINQNGGSVTATGESSATASAGSVKLGQGGNDFDTLAVTAEQEVNVQDTDELAVSIAGNTTGDVRLQAGAPAEDAGDVSLNVTTAITAGGAVTATAAGNATLEKNVQGASVTATATGGSLETKAVTAISGNAALSGASVTTGGDVKANAANADVSIVATGGANTTAGTVEAGRNATIDAGTGEAQVAAVTATAGNAAVIGGAGATVGGNLTAGGNAVVVSDGGAATINPGNTVRAANLGIQGAAVANDGIVEGVNQLAIVQTGDAAMTLTDDDIPAGAQTVGIQSAGDLTVTSGHALTFGQATVAAGGREVAANGLASTAGTVAVSAGGNIASSAITGAAGTTVTTENGGAINVAGNLGQGGETVVNANGAAVNAGTLASGGALTVNNAGAVAANIAAGGNANIQAANIQAGNTQTGGNLVLQVGGDANVGQIAVGGDVNGAVGGVYTVAGGNVGTMGQGGDFTTGQFTLEGDLASGDITMDAGTLQMDGNLDAGGAAVDITAGGGIQGGGVLTAGQLSLAGGAIGAAGNNFQVVTPALQNITGSMVYLVDTQAGTVTVGTIQATGNTLTLQFDNATQINAAGGNGISSGGDINLTVNAGQFGSLDNPIRVTVPGTFTIDGTSPELLHIVVNGDAAASDLVVNYLSAGFAIYGSRETGWQIIGLGPEKQRLINRALAFTVNTPELKSKQGIFGDPAFIHTRMNVSEARAAANMDMLALNAVDFYDTWEHVQSGEGRRALRKWAPKVDMGPNSLLSAKLAAQASEMETQPEVWVPGQTGASSSAPAAPTAPAAPAAE